jgi:hypothetical protein
VQSRPVFSVSRAAGAIYAVEDRSGIRARFCRSAGAILVGSTGNSFRDISRREDDQFCRDGQSESQTDRQNVRLLFSGDAIVALPTSHG